MSLWVRWCAALALVACMVVGGVVAPSEAAGPTATVEPATGLADLQVVTVRGSGFPPTSRIQIMECSGTLAKPPPDDLSCDGTTLNAQAITDDHGSFLNSKSDPSGSTHGFRMFSLPRAGFPPSLTTCDRSHACLLYVGVEQTDFTQPHAFVPFAFAGAAIPGASTSSSSSSATWILVIVAAVVVVLLVAGMGVWLRRRRRSEDASITGS